VHKHWVEFADDFGDEHKMPFVCLGADCERVLLSDTDTRKGESLHDQEPRDEHRCFVWDWTLNEAGDLRILAGGVQILDGIKRFVAEFGDPTLFDILIACEPTKGKGGRKYVVTAVPGQAEPLSDEIMARIAADIPDLMEIVDPAPLGIEEVAKRVGGQVLYPSEDESLAQTEPPPEDKD